MRLSVTVPVFNEAKRLPASIGQLWRFLAQHLAMPWEINIADNGSTDETLLVARSLAEQDANVCVSHLDRRGRGGALKQSWTESEADILSYMDVDLSADLACFPRLIEAVSTGKFDLAIGSRLLNPPLTTRCFKRELASRCYNTLIKLLFRTGFSDAQCGFKAISRRAAADLLPLVEDNDWFFDTELLILAERRGYRIFDCPVRWTENRESHVKIVQTALRDMRGLLRLRRTMRPPPHPLKTPGL